MEIYLFLFILENFRMLWFMMKKNVYVKKNELGSNKKKFKYLYYNNLFILILYIFLLFLKKLECVYFVIDRYFCNYVCLN